MTEELLKIFEENRKTPLEDKLNQTIESFENMVRLFLEKADIIDNKLNSFQQQISSLETRCSSLEEILRKIQLDPDASPQLSQTTPKINKQSYDKLGRDVLDELKELIEKKKKKKD